MVADRYPNFSICGLPFLLGGEVDKWRDLAHRTTDDLREAGLDLALEHRAQAIDAAQKRVTLTNDVDKEERWAYRTLILGTGAVSVRPPIEGLELPGVFTLRWMSDAFALRRNLRQERPQVAVIVGAGYIGMEMAEALIHRGLDVTIIEVLPSVLPTFDAELGALVQADLERHGAHVWTKTRVEAIKQRNGVLEVRCGDGRIRKTDLVIVATGAYPEASLATAAGAETGLRGAIHVSQAMETSLPDVYAAGDCVETWHHLLQRATYLPLGTTAHKQGRVAGANAVGVRAHYAGTLGTQAVKVLEQVAARTGLRQAEAMEEGFDPLTEQIETWDHKAYYPGARRLCLRITGDRKTGQLLGAQIVGAWGSEIAKRVDIFATALYNRMTIEDLSALDLSYTPPLSSPWDPVQIAAQAWERKRRLER
jgi:NADPH-dependent 2,4-dienoyl-CoA reductase/sulfur reductase-like enzyme